MLSLRPINLRPRLATALAAAAVLASAGAFGADETSDGGSEEDQVDGYGLPPLPEWTDDDLHRFRDNYPVNLGGGLWEGFALEPTPEEDLLVASEPPPSLDTAPDLLEGNVVPSEPSPRAAPLQPIEGSVFADTFGQKPESFLIDPRGILPEVKRADVERFLDYHAKESAVPMYLAILRRDELLPEGFDLSKYARHWFPGGNVAVAAYFIGDPHRAMIAVPAPAAGGGADRSAEILDACVMDSLATQEVGEQLDRFIVKLSIRLFWLEKEARSAAERLAAAKKAADAKVAAAKPGILSRVKNHPAALLSAIASGLCLASIAGIFLVRRVVRRRGGMCFIFPEHRPPPRLGAPYSGGTGAVVSYRQSR